MHTTAVYPGTFDPITNGHLDILERASQLFTRVIIAVGENPDKNPMFTHEERLELVRQSILELGNPKISVDHFTGLLAQYAQSLGATAIIRGLRALSDFEHEFQMALANRKLYPDADTIFLMPSEQFVYLSSSMIKTIVINGGDITAFVPHPVIKAFQSKIGYKGGIHVT